MIETREKEVKAMMGMSSLKTRVMGKAVVVFAWLSLVAAVTGVGASPAWATPVTFYFGGEITRVADEFNLLAGGIEVSVYRPPWVTPGLV